MTDKEILNEVYQTCKRERDVGAGEIINIIEQEWQKQDEMEDSTFSKKWYTDARDMERHRGLEIGPDGTVTEGK